MEKLATFAPDDYEALIRSILLSYGIPPLVKGYAYITNAELLMLKINYCINNLSDEIYIRIAAQYETTPDKVERAIRHAIEISWSWEHELSLKKYYPSITKPTNCEFLAFLYEQIS
ncbi:MAG: sporulation initiation factor Spo0A C-terminal domain-containing protein [Oscillospiraceae bacterium]|jgi:two-component system response regulator (stage 0 sporulation protein A)